jgi:DNA-binding response OmpR family regulator
MQTESPDIQKILIVDDNAKNLQVLGKLLQAESLEIEFATNGVAALDWLEMRKFDLILLDINMPGMDGFAVCEKIRANPVFSDMPIVFLTAQIDRESILKGFESGAQDYILKPFDSRELMARVKTQLEIKRGRDEIRKYLDVIEKKNKLIRESIEYARSIQDAFQKSARLPSSAFKESFSLLLPKDILGGDFSFFNQTGKMLTAGVFDGTGHGIPGALISILGITYLNEVYEKDGYVSPDKVLGRIRDKIINGFDQKGDILEISNGLDGALLSFNVESRQLQFSGAFNSVFIVRDRKVLELKGDRMPIAFHSNPVDFSLQTMEIMENDVIYMLTDGYVDQFGGLDNKKYGKLRFLEDIMNVFHLPLEEQKSHFLENLLKWKNTGDQTDDITLIGLKL